MVVAEIQDFVGLAVVLWLVAMLFAIVAGWFKARSTSKYRPTEAKHGDAIKDAAVNPELAHQAAIQEAGVNGPTEEQVRTELAHQAAMKDFGVTMLTGDELRMGWYEHIFLLKPPIAGVQEVWTLHGFEYFTTGNRCLVITDGQRLVILDRERNHGVQLEISQTQWFEASVEGSTVVVSCYQRHGSSELAQRWTIETDTEHNSTLVPEGWLWKSTLYPESSIPDANSL